uniref:Uncharacterized protein n=1 Tax=Panagrolaimus sp. PS1159 TaxID=55785 RepID=A0AC35G472_9BILA
MVKFFSIFFTVFALFFAMIPNIYASVPVAACNEVCPRSQAEIVECCRAHKFNGGGGCMGGNRARCFP